MENYKELITIILLSKIQDEILNIDLNKIKEIFDKTFVDYTIIKNETSLIVSDLNEKIEYYLASKKVDGVKNSSLCNYALHLTKFQQTICKPVNIININDIRLYLAYIQHEKNLKPSSMDTVITTIKGFFAFLHEEGIIAINPAKRIKAIKYDKKSLREHLNVEELEIIRNACKDDREKAIVEFAYSSACRASEIVNMKYENIDFSNRKVYVKDGKGSKDRNVYLSIKGLYYLKKYIKSVEEKGYKGEYLFVSIKKPHNKLTVSGLEKIFKRIAGRTNISKSIYPHLFRHTWATLSYQSGLDITKIQEILGHEHPSTTQIYAKSNTNITKYEYDRIMIG